ncbi:unnamed protein product [Mucor hiemalis]
MANEQDLVNFCEITGASTEVAQNYLQVRGTGYITYLICASLLTQFTTISDNNVGMAISLFWDNGGESLTGQRNNNSTSVNSSRPSSVHSDNDHLMTDEELARQMQRSEEEVRAPIAPKTDILSGGGLGGGMFQHTPPTRWNRDHIGSSRPSVFNQGDSTTGSVSDFLSRLQSDVDEYPSSRSSRSPTSSSPASSKTKRLADLFRPPFDIMYHGDFEEARETAKEKNKWVMINIQNPTEFSCQVMNRDLWSDSFVKDIIKESFIFLQYTNDSGDGKRYSTFYSVSGYPHVAIVDARTGERVKVWETQITPTDFMMEITEFLEQNNQDSTSRPTTAAAAMKRPRVAKNVSDMSEEEQLNAAIAASLNGSSTKEPESTSMDVEERETPLEKDKGKARESIIVDSDEEDKVEEIKEEEIKAGSALDGIKAVKREETKDIANSTRIQLRMGNGTEVPNAETQPFELVFNRTQLIDLLDQTILEAGLVNAAVNCVFI